MELHVFPIPIPLPTSLSTRFYKAPISQFSRPALSDSLGPHELQHAGLSCPSPTPGACSNSFPSSRWCYPTVSSSVIPFSPCLQSFSASGSFLMSQFFGISWPKYWSFSFSVSPSNGYSALTSFRIDQFGLPAVQGTLKSLLQYHSMKAPLTLSFLYGPTHIHPWLVEKP